MKTFHEFESARESLMRAYDRVLSAGILPVEETGEQEVRQRLSDLVENRFILAVCGRIKAGKSTLINALLFGEPVLPSDDTPHTAKNTFVVFGEKKSFKVTFYNKSEWKLLLAEINKDSSEAAKKFKEDLELVSNEGVSSVEYIREEALTIERQGISELVNYVTPAAKGGKFTPYVKEVTVFHPHPWLRSVSVADTPGVDDPYKFREDQTKRFITQAGSILYVSYAGQAMSLQDINFLNEYLLHVPKQRRVIAINKMDVLGDGRAGLESYLDSLSKSPDPAIREVFGTKGSIAFVCALAGLISQLEAQGVELSEDLAWYREKFDRSGLLVSDANGVEVLRAMVEERLVKITGEDLIEGHASFVSALVERKQRSLNTILGLARAQLADLGKSQEQLDCQIENIKREKKTLKHHFDSENKRLGRELQEFYSTLYAEFTELERGILQRTKEDLERDSTIISEIPHQAVWFFTARFDKAQMEFKKALDRCVDSAEKEFRDFSNKIKEEWCLWDTADILDNVLEFQSFITIMKLRDETRRIAKVGKFESMREKGIISFFQELFNPKASKKKLINEIMGSVQKELEKEVYISVQSAIEVIRDQTGSGLHKIEESLGDILRNREEQIKNLLAGQKERDSMNKQLLSGVQEMEKQMKALERLKNDVRITG